MTEPDRPNQQQPPQPKRRLALQVSIAYAVFATSWILASDRVLGFLSPDGATLSLMQTWKGWFFVCITAWLLYLFISRRGVGAPAAPAALAEDRRLTWTIAAAATAVLAVIVLNLVYTLWADRKDLIADAERTTQNLAQVIDEQTTGQFNTLDLTLSSVAQALRFLPASLPQRDLRIHELMREDLRNLPFVRALYIVDAQGRMVHDTNSFPVSSFNFSDREYFRVHRDNSDRGLYVGVPILSRTNGAWFISVSQRIAAPDGSFAGVVVAALEPQYLQRFYQSIKVGAAGAVALFRRDGIMLARAPLVEGALGKDFRSVPLMASELPRAEVGTYHTTSTVDGVARVVSYRAVAGRPLVVLVGLGRDEVLAKWRGRAWTFGLVSFAFMLFIGWLGWIVTRELRRRAVLTMALRSSEERFSKAFHISPAAKSIASIRSGVFLDVNDRYAELFGYTRGEIIGRTAQQLGMWVEQADRARLVEHLQVHGVARDFGGSLRRKDGEIRQMQFSAVVTEFGGTDEPVLIAIFSDITDSLRAQTELADNERRYRMLFDANPQPMWVYDCETLQIVAVNNVAVASYGYSREAFLAMRLTDLRPAEDAASLIARIKDLDQPERHSSLSRHIKKNGELIDVQVESDGLRFAGRRARLVLAVDVTEKLRTEDEVRRLNATLERRVADRTAELEAANKELETFGYTVSHDLRAPLRHMDGFARMAAERLAESDETTRRYLDTIIRSAVKMGLLIDGLLALSRAGRAKLHGRPVDLAVLVREAQEECMADAAGRNIDWHIADLPTVFGDYTLLRQVFINLLSNAVKFTNQRAEARIDVERIDAGAGQVCVCVRDNGAGFDMQYVDKLFGVFQRLHRDDEFAGTGIGLATVKRIVERHGGRVRVEAELGRGAVFYVTLPRA